MAEERFITLSTRGEQIAAEEPVQAAIKAINNNSDFYPSVTLPRQHHEDDDLDFYVDEFWNSELFKKLSLDEQRQSIRAADSINTWSIIGEDLNRPNLFDNQVAVARFDKIGADNLLLSGITMEDLNTASQLDLLEHYGDYGLADRLRFANFIGAAILSEAQKHGAFNKGGGLNSFSYHTDSNQIAHITVSGDMNGDFTMWQHTKHTQGSIDPIGNLHEFSPQTEPILVTGYHSVERALAIAALKHLNVCFAKQEQREHIAAVAEQFLLHHEETTADTINFSDYGDRSEKLYIDLMTSYFNDPELHDQRVWANTDATIGSDVKLRVETQGQNLILSNTYEDKGNIEVIRAISIPAEMTGAFLVALLHQCRAAAGRTSDGQIVNILKARYEMLTK